jgi:hypothetical protein
MEKLVLGMCTGLKSVGWDDQVYNRQHWRTLVVTVMNFRFLHFKEYHSDTVTLRALVPTLSFKIGCICFSLLYTNVRPSTKRAALCGLFCVLTCVNYFNEVLLPVAVTFN